MKLFQPSEIVTSLPTQFFASLVAKVNKVVAAGHDVINLGQGNPDQPTPQHIVKALQDAAEKTIHHKYPPFRGHESLKEAVATFYQREYDVVVNPKTEVAILFGGKAGLVELPICFTNPVIRFSFGSRLSRLFIRVALAKAHFETMPLIAENNFYQIIRTLMTLLQSVQN